MTAKQKQNYQETKDRYENLRERSRIISHKQLPASLLNKKSTLISKDNISFGGFTLDCIKELKRWEKSGTRRVAWDWKTVQQRYKSHPKRFELSVWHMDLFLCGAAIGKPTFGGGKLRLDYIESTPMGSPLDSLITDISIIAGINYAKAIGATQLRINKPVNDIVKDYYLSKPDFAYNKKGNFCYMDI